MKQILTVFKLLLGWPISLLALFFIGKIVAEKSQTVIPSIIQLNIFLLFFGVLCFLTYFFLRSFLWQKLLDNKGYALTLKESAYLWALSELKRFVPGNIWAPISRTMLFSEKKIEKSVIVFSLFKEAQVVLLGSILLSIFSPSFVFYNILTSFPHIQILLFLTYILIGCIFFFYLRKNTLINFIYLAISSASFGFFGLGTYLTISSIVTLSPYYLLTLVSFFSFSYFIGYVSIVTPMGLGVREGIITFGLSRFIPLTTAGLGAIYARVVLICSELIFFVGTFLWYRAKNRFFLSLEDFIKKHTYELLLVLFIAIYIIYFATASFLRYDNFYTGRFDLGNMDQTVWNTFKGRIFQLTDPNGTEIISRLAFHADFILILLAPFYMLWPDPRMLLLAQTIVIAMGAVFVFLIAKKILNNKTVSLAFAFTYLINPSLEHASLYDFHAITFATTFLLGAFYFIIEKKYLFFLAFAILSGLTKENIWIPVSFLGIYIFIKNAKNNIISHKLLGLAVFAFSLAIFYYLIWHAIPNARGSEHFALSYYSDFGDSPGAIIKNILVSPQKIIAILLQTDRLEYVFNLLLPLGFFSLFSPVFLVFAIPDLLIQLLSNNSQLRQIYYHYASPILPFLFIAAIFGFRQLKIYFPKISVELLTTCLIIVSLFAAYRLGPLPGSKNPNIIMFTQSQPDKEEINNFLSKISKNYSVAATNNVGSHLSRRQKIYTIPLGLEEADVLVFLLNDPFAQPSLKAQKEMVEHLRNNQNYKLVFEKGDFVAFQRLYELP